MEITVKRAVILSTPHHPPLRPSKKLFEEIEGPEIVIPEKPLSSRELHLAALC
jgi:hypothetical protein